MNTDFRVWLGIVRTIHDFNDVSVSGRIKLPFSMFLKNCGFDPARSNKHMKARIDASMVKLRMVTFQFRNEDSTLITGLINWARYNIKTNEIEIEGDPRIKELYAIDYKVFCGLRHWTAYNEKSLHRRCIHIWRACLRTRPQSA